MNSNATTMNKDKPRKNWLVMFIHKMGSPPWFYGFSGKLIPWLWAIFAALTIWGLYLGLVKAPADYQQGESFRIMYQCAGGGRLYHNRARQWLTLGPPDLGHILGMGRAADQ